MNSTDNPFYSNHIFTEFDKKRVAIRPWQHLLLWFLPTYVQITECGVFYFKRDFWGRYYLLKVDDVPF